MPFFRRRIYTVICLAASVAIGFWMWRYYDGWGRPWVRYYLSAAVYELIWCLAAFFVWPRRTNIIKIPVAVLVGTCLLEFLQLWKADFLEQFRRTLTGAALIGTDFVWLQFPFYFGGALVSIFLLALLARNN